MKKKNLLPYCLRILQQGYPSTAVELLEFRYDSLHTALCFYQEAMMEAVVCRYVQIELLELSDNDVDYNVIYHCEVSSVNWS